MKALVLDQIDNRTVATVKDIDLPLCRRRRPGRHRLVESHYKDAPAITGKGKIIRQFPMVPGIDFAGQVKESRDPRFVPGRRDPHRLGRGRKPLGSRHRSLR